ncbi:MAG: serine hydrolase domain-containing protein [Bacillota bacterium]
MVFPKNEFNKISCKEAFVNKQSLIDMFEKISDEKLNIHQMILLHEGSKVFSAYAKGYKDKKENVYSVSKSFTSVAIGILIDRNLLDKEDFVLFYFADELKRYKKAYEKLKIKHLLNMTVGQSQDRFIALTPKHNPIEVFFNTEMSDEPGEKFMYSNFASYILSAIVTKVTNKSLNDFLKTEVYEKIGLNDIYWPEFAGYSLGCTGLRLSANDMARFGLLLLNDGNWDGEQIVSKAYLDQATTKQVDTTNAGNKYDSYGYGYQLWINEFGDYRAAGLHNQLIIINKAFKLVFSITAYEDNSLLNLFKDYILSGFKKGWKPTNKSLRNYLSKFSEESVALIMKEESKRQD